MLFIWWLLKLVFFFDFFSKVFLWRGQIRTVFGTHWRFRGVPSTPLKMANAFPQIVDRLPNGSQTLVQFLLDVFIGILLHYAHLLMLPSICLAGGFPLAS